MLASAIQLLTGYFTESNRRPVRDIAQSSETGAATVILSGGRYGMESAVYSALLIAAAVFCSYLLATGNATIALFAVAMAGVGLLTTVGVIVSMDSFGPVTDNAQGIAEMSGDVGGRRRAGAHPPGRDRQHHQGDHQGHRDRHCGAGRDRAVRRVRHPRWSQALTGKAVGAFSLSTWPSRTFWSA